MFTLCSFPRGDMTHNDQQNQTIIALRRTLSALERPRLERRGTTKALGATLPFGIDAIDRHLPEGGLRLGGLHELADSGPALEYTTAAGLMVAGILARLEGPVLWAAERADLFPPALAHVGLALDRVLFVEAPRAVLLAMEEGLRHGGFAGIVGEVRRLDATASRRLQLAAENAGVTAFALRRSRNARDDPAPDRRRHPLAHRPAAFRAAGATGPLGARAGARFVAARSHSMPGRRPRILDRGGL
jgi:hypothetical protein